ncbi:MAG: right-handed parallel beta-helix repeat-containing protein, partial [Bacteroidales bacterium]|nr:right-handed parallel beta-helix repeat-containing protein [Bacteroidales bacterium]
MRYITLFKKMSLLTMLVLATVSIQAQATRLADEPFSSQTPKGWSILPASTWTADSGLAESGKYSMHGIVPKTAGDSATLVTPLYDCTNYKYLLLRFSHICKVLPSDICRIEYQTEVSGKAQPWKPVPEKGYLGGNSSYGKDLAFNHSSYRSWGANDTLAKPTDGWWKQESFNISNIAGGAKVRFRFIMRKGGYSGSSSAAGWFVDDFQLLADKNDFKLPEVAFITEMEDTVYSVGPFTIQAKVASRTTAKIAQPYLNLCLTLAGKSIRDSIRMTAIEGDSVWEATITQQPYTTEVGYSITGRDANGNSVKVAETFVTKRPPTGKPKYYTYYYPADTTGATNHNQQIVYAFDQIRSQSHTIYPGTDINPQNINLSISRIAWYIRMTETPVVVNRNLKVYLLATTNSTITAAYVDPVANKFTLVYDGITTSQLGWNEIVFKKPFTLPAGMNLHIFVEGYGGTTSSTVTYWGCHSVGTSPTTTYSINGGSWTSNIFRPLMRYGIGGGNGNQYDSNSVAMVSIDSPNESSIAGKQEVKITLQNMGDDFLSTCQVNWKVNGVLQTPTTWKGHLHTDFTDTLTLGSYNQKLMGFDTITVWVSRPNNKVDSILDDDTLTVIAFGCDSLLNGTYTVGKGGKYNFPSLKDALKILETCGWNGDVTLKLASGNYPENIQFSNFHAPDGHRLTITSIAGVADSVVFEPASGVVVDMSNSSGITFRNIKFDASNVATYCVQMTMGLKDIEFYHCILQGYKSTTTGNAHSVIYKSSGSAISDIRFIGNQILDGSYGIYFYGSSNTLKNRDIVFDSNLITGFYYYAAYFYYNKMRFTHNHIEDTKDIYSSYNYGMYCYYLDSTLIDANRIITHNYSNYQYSLRTYYTDSTTWISNNEIIMHNDNTTAYGLYTYYSYDTKIINNSVLQYGGATLYGMYVYTGGTAYSAEIKNNLVACIGTGTCYPLYATSTTASANYDFDYNCWWSPSYVGYVGSAISTLAAFQSALPSAKHDIFQRPVFRDTTKSLALRLAIGMDCPKIAGVDYDFNGKLRPYITTRGAHSAQPVPVNGNLISILDVPAKTDAGDTIRPRVVLSNSGTDTITEATIRLELNGVSTGRDIQWKGRLGLGETTNINMGSFVLKGGDNVFKAYIVKLGSLKDTINDDDTVSVSTHTCTQRYAGNYTVGGNNPDFKTLDDAVLALTSCGITGPVTLKIRSGKYDAVTIIGRIFGASTTNTITVMPDSNAKVVIDGGAGTAFSLQNSSHWHFRNITFGNTSNGIIGVEVKGQVEDIHFRHCNIYASTTASTTSYMAVSYPNSSGANHYPVDLQFVGNNIRGGYYNMYLYYPAGGSANMQLSSMTVDSNTLSDAYYYGIYAYYYSHYNSMSYNTVTNRKGSSNIYYGIYNYYYSNVDRVEGNR